MSGVSDVLPIAQITQREREVLELLAVGLSGKEVAKHLSIAPKTVERHVEHVRLKTRTRNRTHMLVKAVREGLLAEID